jgi:CRP-like cAMP-binding protein
VTNRLLTALPAKDREHLLTSCETIELIFGDVLCEPGDRIRHVYFPTNGFISLLSTVNGHAALEVALVGNEGMLGVPLVLDVNISPLRALVQGSGGALRISTAAFERELALSRALRSELNRYIYVLMSQLAQTAACNRFHRVEARLARWFLMTRDRAHSAEFHITHEFLAQMLGVRRVGVTNAAGLLQKQKLISYSRGEVKIHDSAGLEDLACSCYRVDRDTYTRILG